MKNLYIFLGDSLTFGYGVKPKDNWVTKLKDNLNLDIINKGVNGSTTTDMLFRFQEDVIDLNPQNLFIMGGTNDLLSNRSIDSIVSNVELMIKDSINNNIKVILGIPPTIIPDMANRLFMKCDAYDYCKNSLPLLRCKLLELCELYSIKHIDFFSASNNTTDAKQLYLDGIHFNEIGQNILYSTAKEIYL